MSNKPLVLVTGVTGFLGSEIVHQLLQAGYPVRGTARSSKVALAREGYAQYKDYEVVPMDDLISGDYTAALNGVQAIIHQAAPLPGKEAGPDAQIDAAVEGSLNILRQGEKIGIKTFVFASSFATVAGRNSQPTGGKYTDQDWNTATRQDALDNPDPMFVYSVEKVLQEKAIWEFAERHPHIDVTTVNPPFFFGPFAPGFRAKDTTALSANAFIYALLDPATQPPTPVGNGIDIRDVARGMINALSAPTNVGRKRILMSGEWFSWKDAVELVATERPQLKDRLSVGARSAGPAPAVTPIDNTRAEEVLGLKFTPWKVTVIDAVDSLLELEKGWKGSA